MMFEKKKDQGPRTNEKEKEKEQKKEEGRKKKEERRKKKEKRKKKKKKKRRKSSGLGQGRDRSGGSSRESRCFFENGHCKGREGGIRIKIKKKTIPNIEGLGLRLLTFGKVKGVTDGRRRERKTKG